MERSCGDDEGNESDEVANVLDSFCEYYKNKFGEEIVVEYVTYATNEVMLSTLETGRSQYDLICPSDYVFQAYLFLSFFE